MFVKITLLFECNYSNFKATKPRCHVMLVAVFTKRHSYSISKKGQGASQNYSALLLSVLHKESIHYVRVVVLCAAVYCKGLQKVSTEFSYKNC